MSLALQRARAKLWAARLLQRYLASDIRRSNSHKAILMASQYYRSAKATWDDVGQQFGMDGEQARAHVYRKLSLQPRTD